MGWSVFVVSLALSVQAPCMTKSAGSCHQPQQTHVISFLIVSCLADSCFWFRDDVKIEVGCSRHPQMAFLMTGFFEAVKIWQAIFKDISEKEKTTAKPFFTTATVQPDAGLSFVVRHLPAQSKQVSRTFLDSLDLPMVGNQPQKLHS